MFFLSLLFEIFLLDQYEYYQHLFKSNQISTFDEHKYEIDYLKKGQVCIFINDRMIEWIFISIGLVSMGKTNSEKFKYNVYGS
jgi:hypothetical protein